MPACRHLFKDAILPYGNIAMRHIYERLQSSLKQDSSWSKTFSRPSTSVAEAQIFVALDHQLWTRTSALDNLHSGMMNISGSFGRSGQRGNRGRGSASGRWQGGAKTSAGTGPTNQEPVGKLLLTIRPEQERTTPKGIKPTIEGCRYVASYNWLDGKDPTIVVPGSPPTWTPPKGEPRKLQEDNGTYYRDQNAARYSTYPSEPAIRALLKENPDYECPKIQIVGCGNTLGSLLSACSLSEERTFEFGAERVGNTIFLVRQTSPGQLIENVRGYGHSFPEAYTTWPRDVKGSASHQRLVEYTFAGLRFLIRSESDGYLPDKMTPRVQTEGRKAHVPSNMSLEEATNTLVVSNVTEATSSTLVMRSAAHAVPQKAIFDLKTRSLWRDVGIAEFLPRLWVNQTPNFIFARHDYGVFKEIDIKDVKHDVQQWESANQNVLFRLHGVLNKLIELTGKAGCSRVQVHRVGAGPLQISEPVKKWRVLPRDLRARWQGKKSGEENVADDHSDETDSEDENEDYLKF